MIEADKLINKFMGNRNTDVQYYNSWDNLMKVTKHIFRKYEKDDTAKICELLRYALYWNDFEDIYAKTIFLIKHFKNSN